MSLSVVVPTWRRPADLARCLEGLAAQSAAPTEVLVVARSDDDESRSALETAVPPGLPVRALWADRPRVVPSLNLGLGTATADIVAITDDDAVPRPDWLERMAEHFGRDSGVGAVGGRDYIHEGGRLLDDGRPTVGRIRWYGRVVGNHHLGVGGPREVDLLKGVSMGFRREALHGIRVEEALRGAGMQLHWEMGLCLAVKAAGWRIVYDPSVSVDHFPAPRPDGHDRHGPALAALSDEIYNETYCLARRLPWRRALPAVTYGLLVGSRRAPGPVTAVERAVRGGRRPGALQATTRARCAALRAAARARLRG